MLQNQLANLGDKMFDNDTAKIVRKHSFWGAVVLSIPIPVLELIPFVIILWHMYYKLSERANQSLDFGNIIVGVLVNIGVALVLGFLIGLIPVVGWLGHAFTTYLQFYLSGKLYLETIKNK